VPRTLEKTASRPANSAQPVAARSPLRLAPWTRPLLLIALVAVFIVASWAAAQKTSLSLDLRGDVCAKTQALLENSAFVAADSGDRICDHPCHVQLALKDDGTLDHAFVLAAISESGGRATSLLLRTAPTSLSAIYNEATEMLVALAFPDEEIALLDNWFRRAKHDARAAQSFLAHHQSADCSLRLGILRADEDRRWKIALELSFD
jgi:hypothetical protein